MSVQSVLTYDPATVTRLANTLTTLSSLPNDVLTRDHHIHSLLTQLGNLFDRHVHPSSLFFYVTQHLSFAAPPSPLRLTFIISHVTCLLFHSSPSSPTYTYLYTETKVTSECSDLVSDRISYAIGTSHLSPYQSSLLHPCISLPPCHIIDKS